MLEEPVSWLSWQVPWLEEVKEVVAVIIKVPTAAIKCSSRATVGTEAVRIPFIVIEAFATIVDDLKVALEAFKGLPVDYVETEMKFAYFIVGVAEVSTAKLAVAHRH